MNSAVRAIMAIGAVAALAACDSDNDDVVSNRVDVPVTFVHAVPDAPDVTARATGNSAGGSTTEFVFDYRESNAVNLPPGSTSVFVFANTPGGPVPVIGPVDVQFDEGSRYSIIASGEVDPLGEPIAPIVLANPDTTVAAATTRVEVVHAAPGAPPVDIFVTAPGDPLAGAAPIAGGATPFGANSGQLEVPAGDYQIRVTLPSSTVPVFDSGTVALPGGADLLVVAKDNTGPGAAPIILFVQAGDTSFEILDIDTPADVRVVHAVPDAPPVDVYVNDATAANAPAISGLPYGGAAIDPNTYVSLTAGTNNVLVTAAGNAGVVAIPATDLELAAGQQYTVYASGLLADGIVPFITEDDDRPVATEARIRIAHLSPSAGPVDIYVTAPNTDITNIEPNFAGVELRQETGYVELAGGNYDVTVTLAGTKTAAIGPATITLSDGGVYTAAARDPDPNVANDPFGLILLDDF